MRVAVTVDVNMSPRTQATPTMSNNSAQVNELAHQMDRLFTKKGEQHPYANSRQFPNVAVQGTWPPSVAKSVQHVTIGNIWRISAGANQSWKIPTPHRTMLNMSHGQHEATAGLGHIVIIARDKGTQETGVSRTGWQQLTSEEQRPPTAGKLKRSIPNSPITMGVNSLDDLQIP